MEQLKDGRDILQKEQDLDAGGEMEILEVCWKPENKGWEGEEPGRMNGGPREE